MEGENQQQRRSRRCGRCGRRWAAFQVHCCRACPSVHLLSTSSTLSLHSSPPPSRPLSLARRLRCPRPLAYQSTSSPPSRSPPRHLVVRFCRTRRCRDGGDTDTRWCRTLCHELVEHPCIMRLFTSSCPRLRLTASLHHRRCSIVCSVTSHSPSASTRPSASNRCLVALFPRSFVRFLCAPSSPPCLWPVSLSFWFSVVLLVGAQPQMPGPPQMPSGGPGGDSFQTQQAGAPQGPSRSHPPSPYTSLSPFPLIPSLPSSCAGGRGNSPFGGPGAFPGPALGAGGPGVGGAGGFGAGGPPAFPGQAAAGGGEAAAGGAAAPAAPATGGAGGGGAFGVAPQVFTPDAIAGLQSQYGPLHIPRLCTAASPAPPFSHSPLCCDVREQRSAWGTVRC